MSAGRYCRHCGGLIDDADDAVEAMVAEIRARCADLNIAIGLSSTVTEADAARLLDRSPNTLANWRFAECPIPYQKLGHRVRYTLRDLAKWVLDNRS